MKELTAFEIQNVSGAGWLQDNLASLGSSIGASAWAKSSSLLNIELPIVGNIDLATISPDLGTQVGSLIGSAIGFAVEGALAGIPIVGGIFNKLLGN